MIALPLNIKKIKPAFTVDNFFVFCLLLSPVFTLSLQKWIGACLLVSFSTALYILTRNKKQELNFFSSQVSNAWLKILIFTLLSPFAAIALAQLFRQEFIASSFDNASKFLFAIPIVLLITQKKINVFKLFEYIVPTTILVTMLSVLINPNIKYGISRTATYFVDPLSFGSICLALALTSLAFIDFYKSDTLWTRLYKLSGFVIGLHLSFISGSRTGWMAIPMVLWLWLKIKKNIPHWAILTSVTLFCAGIYLSMPEVRSRIDLGIIELFNYQWNSLNPDDSIGMRISFVRIGCFLFSHNPLAGWGDAGFRQYLNAPELQQFATEYTRDFTFRAGFHNEIITNMVRSGIWGLFSSIALFFVPLLLFIKGLRSQSKLVRSHALIAISYFICVLISGMSTEVFNLKFTASFHALMIASFSASLLVLMSSEKTPKSL